MAESTRASTGSPDGRPLERALRARADGGQLALLQSYRDFIAHSEACEPCRTSGVDCQQAGQLRDAWRIAREAATP